jgi:hypothetical protein
MADYKRFEFIDEYASKKGMRVQKEKYYLLIFLNQVKIHVGYLNGMKGLIRKRLNQERACLVFLIAN